MAATQNPNEMRLEELKATQAKINAEIASIKAEIAAEKAAEEDAIMNAKADMQLMGEASGIEDRAEMANQPVEETIDRGFGGKYDDIPLSDREKTRMSDNALITQARGLTGERDEDGTLIPIEAEQEVVETEEEVMDINEVIEGLEFTGIKHKDKKILDDAARLAGERREVFVASPEFQAKFGDKYDEIAKPLEVTIIKGNDEAIEADAEAKWQELMDIDPNIRTDEMSEKMRHSGIDPEQGRTKPVESDARSEKPGWETEEGSNTWSINEKDDYWKTEEGFDEAMNLYGQKPSWLKEPTLVYNPETDEYEEIEEEEFEDFSRPAVSDDIRKLLG